MTCKNGGSTGSSSVAGSSSRTSASWALATRQSRIATCCVCRRLWSSVCARLISRGAIRLGASPRVKFTSISARSIDASMPEQPPPRRLEVEERLRDLEQHVVARRLEVGLARRDHPPRRQRGEDRVGQPDRQGRPAADEERLPALAEVLAGEDVLLDAVMAEVIDAGVEVGDPQRLGLELQGQGLLDLGRRRGDIERADPGQLQRGRQVDRQAPGRRGIHPAAGQPGARRAGDRLGGRRGQQLGERRGRRAGESRRVGRRRRGQGAPAGPGRCAPRPARTPAHTVSGNSQRRWRLRRMVASSVPEGGNTRQDRNLYRPPGGPSPRKIRFDRASPEKPPPSR